MGKNPISMAMFNSYVSHYQRVNGELRRWRKNTMLIHAADPTDSADRPRDAKVLLDVRANFVGLMTDARCDADGGLFAVHLLQETDPWMKLQTFGRREMTS